MSSAGQRLSSNFQSGGGTFMAFSSEYTEESLDTSPRIRRAIGPSTNGVK